MKIIVTVKHVPETGAVTLDEATGTMKRDGVESIPNPLDLYAVEAALRLRERYGGTITAISMGPAAADRSLREVIAMGCDEAVLVTGREFAGSDTLATSRALARTVEKLGGCDLLIFGERATDGDTGQVGPGTSALLNLPLAAYVATIDGCAEESGAHRRIVVERLTEEGYEKLALELPAALTVVKAVATPRLPTLRGKQRARRYELPRWCGADLELAAEETGLKGSPTRVEHIFHPRISRNGELIMATDEKSVERAATLLADFIVARLPGTLGSAPATGKTNDAPEESPQPGQLPGAEVTATGISATHPGAQEVLVVAEDRGGRIDGPITWELLGRARQLVDKLAGRLSVAAFLGKAESEEIEELFRRGADRVYLAESPILAHFVVETRSSLLLRIVHEHTPVIVLASATTAGRTLMPHLAVRLGTGLTADCTDLDIDPATQGLLQTRPAIGGNIMATIRTRDRSPNMATVRPHSAPPAPRSRDGRGEILSVTLSGDEMERRVMRLGCRTFEEESVDLQDAAVVVSCGRGFKKKERLDAASALAKLLGASLGASREAVDRGWMSYPHQVGLSGKTVSPELYVALGISGAVQHLAGIKTAKTIVAVNTDPDAPIFKVADFGVIGDLFAVVPPLVERLRERMSAS